MNVPGREAIVTVNTQSRRSFPTLFEIPDFSGRKIEIPATEEDDYTYFVLDQASEVRNYYDDNGYVVVRGLLPQGLCDRANASFETEVKRFGGFIYRQA